jgi:hypothetical protein
MKLQSLFTATLLGLCLGSFGPGHPLARSIQLADGTTHFSKIPKLRDTQSSNNRVRATARHYYTIDLPSEAGEALGQVTFTQTEGSDRFWRYNLSRIRAFEGPYSDRDVEFSIGEVTFNPETRTLALTFDPPIEPGRQVTIQVPFVRNPPRETILMFRVQAFPAGENPVGRFLGYGRFHFYDNRGNDRFGFW